MELNEENITSCVQDSESDN